MHPTNPFTPGLGGTFSAPGQVADPDGGDLRGVAPGYNFEKAALGHPELILIEKSREVTLYADIFEDHIHLHCPFCRLAGHEHGLFVRKGVREWLYDPMAKVTPFPGWDEHRMLLAYPKGAGGRLELAPCTCPWCKVKFAIDHNVVRRVG